MNNNKLNEEMFECKMYITDLETDRKSKEIDVQDLVFSVTFYSPQYHKLQSNWNSLREWLKTERDYYFENYYYSDFNAYGSKLNDVLDKMNELEGVDND